MPEITPIQTPAATTDAESPQVTANTQRTRTRPHQAPKPGDDQPAGAMPSIEELLGRVQRLEAEKSEAEQAAAGYKEQFEKVQAKLGATAELSTTTTKPVWPFRVTGPSGVEEFDVVDEGEAKRLYCVKHKIDPSLFALSVTCTKPKERDASIVGQYQDANRRAAALARGQVDDTRVPGVHIG